MWRDFDLHKRLVLRDGLTSLRCHCSSVFFDAAIPFGSLLRLYSADPAETRAYLAGVRAALPERDDLRITAPGGTNLRLTSRQWDVHSWRLITHPVEETVEGKIVADAGVFFSYADQPIELHIEDGSVVDIWCADCDNVVYRKYLACMEAARARDSASWQLTKVGIGGNPHARITDVAIETMSVQRTVHFCFGEDSWSDCGGRYMPDWHGGAVIVNYPEYLANYG
jgi:leucyl aminopeptidase (aminopeptidase T)